MVCNSFIFSGRTYCGWKPLGEEALVLELIQQGSAWGQEPIFCIASCICCWLKQIKNLRLLPSCVCETFYRKSNMFVANSLSLQAKQSSLSCCPAEFPNWIALELKSNISGVNQIEEGCPVTSVGRCWISKSVEKKLLCFSSFSVTQERNWTSCNSLSVKERSWYSHISKITGNSLCQVGAEMQGSDLSEAIWKRNQD